jgi:hypothetical protein
LPLDDDGSHGPRSVLIAASAEFASTLRAFGTPAWNPRADTASNRVRSMQRLRDPHRPLFSPRSTMLTLALTAFLAAAQTAPPAAPSGAPPAARPGQPAQRAPQATGPIVAMPAFVDFGVVKPDELLTTTVKLVNPLDRPVTITKAVPSCQCTGVDLEGKTIPANGELEFSLSMKMSKAPVVKMANLQVLFDGGLQQVLKVDLKAQVAYAIRANPPFIDVTENKPKTGTYTLSAADGAPFRVLSVDNKPPVFQGFDPAKDAPRSSYVLQYDYSAATGAVLPYVVIETDRPDCPLVDLRVRHPTTRITTPLHHAEFRSSFGKIGPGESGTFELELEKMNSQRVTGVRSLSDVATVELVDQKSDGKNVVITVKVTPAPGKTGILFFQVEIAAGAIKSPQWVYGLVR